MIKTNKVKGDGEQQKKEKGRDAVGLRIPFLIYPI
jgi:hypothetical protein